MRQSLRHSLKLALSVFSILMISATSYAVNYNPTFFNTKDSGLTDKQLAIGALNQNIPPVYKFHMLRVGAFGNLDVTTKTMQKTMPGEEQDYFALSNVGVNTDIDIASWIQGHVGVAYFKSNKGQGDINKSTGTLLDDAFFVVSNENVTPFFLQGGRFYLPFGLYNRYDITPSLAQMLAISRATGFQLGILDWYGITASAYIAQGFVTHDSFKIQGDFNSGLALVFAQTFLNDDIRALVGFQYMYNMLNTNALRQGGMFAPNKLVNDTTVNVYRDRTDGIAVQLKFGYKMVDVFANYVTALKASQDIILLRTMPTDRTTGRGCAKPSAWDIGAAVNFNLFGLKTIIDGSYQRSYKTAGLFVFNALPVGEHPFPFLRYNIGITVFATKNAFIRLQWGHNELYAKGKGDNGRQGDDAKIRIGFRG